MADKNFGQRMAAARAAKRLAENGGAGEAGGLLNTEHSVTHGREQTDGSRTSQHTVK